MAPKSFSIGQAVHLRSGSAWDRVVSASAVGVVVGLCGNGRYRVAFPAGEGRSPLVGEFAADELLAAGRA